MTDDRSERLRKRRKRSTEAVERQHDGSADRGDSSQPDRKRSYSSGNDDADTSASDDGGAIKEEQVGTYMYLPETQTKELRRLYNVLKAEYEFKYDDDFEKNRHFYPLVVQYGLEQLDELSASEIRTRLEEIP
ncbi:hypothetical protein [Halapricum desulfuricans]|uniref:DUF8160 domain-containing protein n=1 Tax=Halapricum desulfuricans TaxID=2841257 RepID=A0A897NND3_9EURY|nr:hypothetical protein [Halapricum desulfuricans]QSG13944.1 Uncharacterized protein HSEST_0395 [Halapricum desulfuricans]